MGRLRGKMHSWRKSFVEYMGTGKIELQATLNSPKKSGKLLYSLGGLIVGHIRTAGDKNARKEFRSQTMEHGTKIYSVRKAEVARWLEIKRKVEDLKATVDMWHLTALTTVRDQDADASADNGRDANRY